MVVIRQRFVMVDKTTVEDLLIQISEIDSSLQKFNSQQSRFDFNRLLTKPLLDE